MKLRTLCFLLCTLFAQTLMAQSNRYVLVLSKGEHKMWVLDYQSLDLVSKIPVGEDPHEIALSTDQSTAYVSNAVIAGRGHIINVLDLKQLKPIKDIDTKPFEVPHGMAYHNDTLWYTAQGSKAVIAYDVKQDKPVQVLGTGQNFTHLLQFNADGKTFYTSNVESGTISIFEKKQIPPYLPPTGVLPANAKNRIEWRQTLVDVGYGAEGFDVSSDGKTLWTARPDGYLVIVDLVKKRVQQKINTHVLGLHRIKFTPDGKTVCVVSVKTGELLFYNTASHKLEQTMHIGQGAGVFMDAASKRMFISCTPDNYISVMDLTSRKEIKRIQVARPDGVTAVHF